MRGEQHLITTSGKYKYVRRGSPKLMTEHRLVLHMTDPRQNECDLVVHHIDGNKSNNSPDNLVWMSKKDHASLHHSGENHSPCSGESNANYRHGMCVGGQSKQYKKIHNKKYYQSNREAVLSKQRMYADAHREHKRWYDKLRYWEKRFAASESQTEKEACLKKIIQLKENAL